MTKAEAHAILDIARAGGLVPVHYISQALVVTGDIGHWTAKHVEDEPLPAIGWPLKAEAL